MPRIAFRCRRAPNWWRVLRVHARPLLDATSGIGRFRARSRVGSLRARRTRSGAGHAERLRGRGGRLRFSGFLRQRGRARLRSRSGSATLTVAPADGGEALAKADEEIEDDGSYTVVALAKDGGRGRAAARLSPTRSPRRARRGCARSTRRPSSASPTCGPATGSVAERLEYGDATEYSERAARHLRPGRDARRRLGRRARREARRAADRRARRPPR